MNKLEEFEQRLHELCKEYSAEIRADEDYDHLTIVLSVKGEDGQRYYVDTCSRYFP